MPGDAKLMALENLPPGPAQYFKPTTQNKVGKGVSPAKTALNFRHPRAAEDDNPVGVGHGFMLARWTGGEKAVEA